MENKKKFRLIAHIIISVLVLAVGGIIMCSAYSKVKAETLQKQAYIINQSYDTNILPRTNMLDGWYDLYGTYSTTDFYYIFLDSSYYTNNSYIGSCILTFGLEYTTENSIVYTNNQDNECFCEFTYFNGNINSSIDTYLFDFYVPTYRDDIVYGENTWYSFYADLGYVKTPYNKLVIRMKKTFFNGLDTDWYPTITPLSFTIKEESEYWYDFGYSNGYDDGYNQSYDDNYDEIFRAGQLSPDATHDYGIKDLLFTIYDVPFTVLYNVFSFTIFGTTAWTIITSLLAILLVVWIVKRFVS